ncbi:hypothetical protein ISN44_As10g014580 [Arabidopsis suecica]|uniref:Uncharacterized protein n=1 Tax=Arabidopsis suecica TaxID=45249 RepID=A0A8T1ZZ31_ARASU|nr:hypothetical protein ISN44_As10g014580 [Arabidopsis suecica]
MEPERISVNDSGRSKRVSEEDGIMDLRYGSREVPLRDTVFFSLQKSAWLVSKMGRLTVGVHEPMKAKILQSTEIFREEIPHMAKFWQGVIRGRCWVWQHIAKLTKEISSTTGKLVPLHKERQRVFGSN